MEPNRKSQIGRNVTVFVALAVVYAVLIIAAGNLADSFAQTVLVGTGCAVFGAGLVFFLVRMFQLNQEK